MAAKRTSSQVDTNKVEAAIKALLKALGEDPNREGLRGTPSRVARMYRELLAGQTGNDGFNPTTFSTEGYDEVILLKDIPIYSLCEHHLLPFVGKACVAYLPGEKIIGLSKLGRMVERYARRLQIQERMTTQIAEYLETLLKPQGVMVVIEAEHFCMTMRGLNKPGVKTVTSCVRGVFLRNMATREEVMRLIKT